jgi:2,3-bisphosphoglycerate-dependent phosphoglycerate mutase
MTHTTAHKLVMLRHGESAWNKENRFTGWVDVDLAPSGMEEARRAARQLRDAGLDFDIAFTSVLKRAIRTLWITLDELDRMWIPVHQSWRMNERHYGALQGLNKAQTAERFGEQQVHIWRRSFDTPPPPLPAEAVSAAAQDPRYRALGAHFPATECLKDTVARVIPFWKDSILPAMRAGRRVLLVAHGNSLRALIKYLDQIPDEAIAELNIPTAQPLVYEFDAAFKPLGRSFLASPEEIAAAQKAVAEQAKAARA